MRVVLATHNPNKVREFQGILGRMLPELEIVAYEGPEPVEDGTSFDENALIKARAAAAHTGLPALADDSGICVDVLGGAPGIFSARWAGHGRGAQANLELLLDQLADIAPEHRSARFACHIALVVPETGFEQVVSGSWAGSIATAARGAEGHGYDPIFVPEGLEVTAAELTAEQKNAVSHRARAFDAAVPMLRMSLITD